MHLVICHSLLSAAWEQWPSEPITLVLLIASAAIYAAGAWTLWRRARIGSGLAIWQVAAFAGGLATLAVALLSPLAWLSDVLFSAHMTQHELLMLIAAPLLVIGQPLFAALWALPARGRETFAAWTRRRGVVRAWRTLTAPLTAFLLHGVVLWIWHIPVLFDAALGDWGIHAVQHISFVVTAALFWWGMIHGRYGRMAYGAAVLYVFLTAVHTSVLGALMTVAPTVWYPAYETAARVWQVDALEDQQLAGLVMWVPSGLVFIVYGLALFAAWLGESGRRVALGSIGAPPPR